MSVEIGYIFRVKWDCFVLPMNVHDKKIRTYLTRYFMGQQQIQAQDTAWQLLVFFMEWKQRRKKKFPKKVSEERNSRTAVTDWLKWKQIQKEIGIFNWKWVLFLEAACNKTWAFTTAKSSSIINRIEKNAWKHKGTLDRNMVTT